MQKIFLLLISLLHTLTAYDLYSLLHVMTVDIQKRYHNTDNTKYIEIVNAKYMVFSPKRMTMGIEFQVKVNSPEIDDTITVYARVNS
jgi:hypothetical protein